MTPHPLRSGSTWGAWLSQPGSYEFVRTIAQRKANLFRRRCPLDITIGTLCELAIGEWKNNDHVLDAELPDDVCAALGNAFQRILHRLVQRYVRDATKHEYGQRDDRYNPRAAKGSPTPSVDRLPCKPSKSPLKRSRNADSFLLTSTSRELDPLYAAERHELVELVRMVVMGLPIHLRNVVIRHYFEDEGLMAIDESEGLQSGTSKRRLFTARKLMRAELLAKCSEVGLGVAVRRVAAVLMPLERSDNGE
jgi:DNA-directed RNA polymerase specialized sigma24 family protein